MLSEGSVRRGDCKLFFRCVVGGFQPTRLSLNQLTNKKRSERPSERFLLQMMSDKNLILNLYNSFNGFLFARLRLKHIHTTLQRG